MSTDNAEHMTDVSTQEGNTNNEIPADSASLQIQAIANSLVPKILQGVNERLPDLVTNILKVLCQLQGMMMNLMKKNLIGTQVPKIIKWLGTQLPNKPVIGTHVPNKLKMQMPKIL